MTGQMKTTPSGLWQKVKMSGGDHKGAMIGEPAIWKEYINEPKKRSFS
jgi:hypothetical protein